MNSIPYLTTTNVSINKAYRLAVANLYANIYPFKDGVLEKEEPVVIAGLGYVTPWTRDAAINTWNACGLICPDVSLNTLKSVINKNDKGYYIDGEYWDKIIWAVGAWWYYLYNGDTEFLKIAYEAIANTLEYMEETEFNEELNLFRGPACYGDGVAAYTDIYAKHLESGIITFAEKCRELCVDKGVGIPIYVLSTNCLYYYAYVLADKMANVLGKAQKYQQKALDMKNAINRNFWSKEKGNYTYIKDDFGGCDYQEGLGISFAMLFDVADDEQKKNIMQNFHTTLHGMPCVYPSFERYNTSDGQGFGRHSGTVWPHVQGFWGSAVSNCRNSGLFDKEFMAQTANAIRSMQFAEIYHPLTGMPYGGRQERYGETITEWRSEPYQTWSATAYLRNVYRDLIGLNFTCEGIRFNPIGSKLTNHTSLIGLHYRNAILNITINGNGNSIESFKINGKDTKPFIDADACGVFDIEIILK